MLLDLPFHYEWGWGPTLGTLRGLQSRGARGATPFIYDVDALSDAQATPPATSLASDAPTAPTPTAPASRATANWWTSDTAAMHYDHAHGFFDWLQNRE